jgi:ketosteroid isomerase-like protein
MTSPSTRTESPAEIAHTALLALINGDAKAITAVYAPDVVGLTPVTEVLSREQLIAEVSDQRTAFSSLVLTDEPAETGSGTVATEWVVTAVHTGPVEVDDLVIEPTGAVLTLRGAMFAEIRDGQVVRFRQYWNEVDLIEQLGLLPA